MLPRLVCARSDDDAHQAEWMLERAIQCLRVGHSWFWLSKSCGRLTQVDQFLQRCNPFQRRDLEKQCKIIDALHAVFAQVEAATEEARLRTFRELLGKLQFPAGGFGLPVDWQVRVKSLLVAKCRLVGNGYLVAFESFFGDEPFYVLFQVGRSYHPEQVATSLVLACDQLWRRHKLEMWVTCYNVVCTGERSAMVQVIRNAKTLASIAKEEGGAMGCLKQFVLLDYLKRHQVGGALDTSRFVMSCASCFVLGFVFDWNSTGDAIMMTQTGELFQVDFGKSSKRKFSTVLLSPQVQAVIGQSWDRFVECATMAYTTLRNYPVLQMCLPDDVGSVTQRLHLDKTEEEAVRLFKEALTHRSLVD